MNTTELKTILTEHDKWVIDSSTGAHANLCHADLHGANLDYACWPLSCCSKDVKVDARIAAQLAAHFCVMDCDDPAYQAARAAILEFAKTSHRAGDLGLLED